ncbi:DNA polymerase III subunit alpha [Flavitalea flava]
MYLNCKTYFSFRYGTFATEALVEKAVELGVNGLALTNINNTCDAWDFVRFCRQHGVKPILGAEIRNGNELLYILLAANNQGLQWINRFLSQWLQAKEDFPASLFAAPQIIPAVSPPAVFAFFDGAYFGKSFPGDPADGFVLYPLGKKEFAGLLPNERIGVLPTEVNKLFNMDIRGQVREYADKLVIRHPVTFEDKTGYNIHRLLRAIDKNTLLSKLSPGDTAAPDEIFLSPAELLHAFRNHVYMVTNTYKLMDACSISMDFGKDKNKRNFSVDKADDMQLLKKLAYDGLKFRYGKNNKIASERVDKELRIIGELNFNSYFLITWDIIRYAQNRGFYYVGRGSGANSIVAYCLQITDVDPIELDLYFERFLNPHRTSPPDFDIDFSWLDRDEVIDYVFKRYGRDHVALLGMYTTFQYNALIRELGKVFGLPKAEIDELAGRRSYHSRNGDKFTGTGHADQIYRLILQYGQRMQNFPNHSSIHPGGMLVSEEPIHAYTAIYLPPKNFNTTQFDMFVAEHIGLYKFDILSQRGLGHIKEAIRLVRENRSVSINIHEVEKFKKDPRVREQIRTVQTIGCFYIESPAMRQLLRKLECDDYITLVAASSIIRPGVSQSGMMREYILRYHNPEKIEYLHPKMEELLKETYGVMVYQEDVIKVAHYFAGLDMGEADILRRAMSGKYRGNKEMLRIREKFFANCAERGYTESTSGEVWRQIESFGGYSFSKAHSASFAVESYQSLYLKTYYPMEFMVAVINNFGGFYSTELYFYELMKTGAIVHAPCINNSEHLSTIRGTDVYVGLVHIREMENNLSEKIMEQRAQSGHYLHLPDFIERTGIALEQLNILIRVGALRFTEKNKKQLLWEANFFQKKNKTHIPSSRSLYKDKPLEFKLPDFPVNELDDLFDEIEILGFPLRNPFELVDDDPLNYSSAASLDGAVGQQVTVLAYLITYKGVSTVKKETMFFGTFIDVNRDWVDTVHFPDSLRQYPLQGGGFYKITGKVVAEFGVCAIEVTMMQKVGVKKRKTGEL